MLLSFVQKLFLIVLFITINCKTLNACDYSCLSKSYSYKDGDKDIASVTFTAKQVNGVNFLTINLIGYDIKESESNQVSVSINNGGESNKYVCTYTELGSTSAYIANPITTFNNGSSMYQDNTLYCSWTMSRDYSSWPKTLSDNNFDLEFNSNYNILLSNLNQSFLVAENTMDLPIYQMKFLKCCNNVYGNDNVQFFVRQTETSNDLNVFALLDGTSYSSIYIISVKLTGSDLSSLSFDIYYNDQSIDGYLRKDGVQVSINSQISHKCILSNRGSWSIPLAIKGSDEDYDTRNRVYDLQISVDNLNVYSEKGISLKSSGSTLISNIFIIFLAFVIHQTIL